MSMSQDEVGGLIRKHLPDEFLRRALRGLFVASEAAWSYATSEFEPTEAENVVGWLRRGRVEANLRGAAQLSLATTTTTVKGPDSNWNHVEVRSGPVVLTANAVPYPCSMVDQANFRDTLAEGNQGALDFGDRPEAPQITESKELYVLLLHSKYRGANPTDTRTHGHLPGSAHLVCPSPEFKTYLWEFNLFDAFAEVVAQFVPNSWDEEAKVNYLIRSRKTAWQSTKRAS